jgi:hypothetical protein
LAYFALACPSCGRWRSAEVRRVRAYVFRCFRCGGSRKLKLERGFGLSVRNIEALSMAGAAKVVLFKNGGVHHDR